MAKNTGIWLIGGAIALYFIFKPGMSAAAATNAAPDGAAFDLSALNYPPDSVQALQNLYDVLAYQVNPDNGGPLTTLQTQLMLSQALQETGLFTPSPNWSAIGVNNFAGIMPNGNYPAGNGTRLANYPDIPTFTQKWLSLLTQNNDPLQATTVNDFINRLLANGYIVQGDVASYQTGMPVYFNLLTSVAQ